MSTSESLDTALASCLPENHQFYVHHVSTPPTLTCALYTPPTGTSPEKTYCESHLLVASHAPHHLSSQIPLAIFAIEVLIYTTARLTTVFVSKADSTGFATNLPSTGHSSVLRSVASTFVSHLIERRHRPDRRLVLSLFARAQDQYLFPGSIENSSKHILNDRQLVKWWCRTLDPVLRKRSRSGRDAQNHSIIDSNAYLIVPGHDARETAAFFPPSAGDDPAEAQAWQNVHPLRDIAPYPPFSTPPRSLIPHFPDDPKSRFLLDLDEEISDAPVAQRSQKQHKNQDGAAQPSPRKRGTGMWKSIKSIEQFWDMMAWRQECSSGRLVGFLWITFTPHELVGVPSAEQGALEAEPTSPSLRPKKRKRDAAEEAEGLSRHQDKSRKKPRRPLNLGSRRLHGFIIPRAPRVKSGSSNRQSAPEKTKHFYWPTTGRGHVIIDEKAYARVHEILLRLDFTGAETARASTAKWIREVAITAGRNTNQDWGVHITGKMNHGVQRGTPSSTSQPNVLSAGLLRKRRPQEASNMDGAGVTSQPSPVYNLGADFVNKKPRSDAANTVNGQSKEHVNVLSSGIVRKKARS